MGGFETQQSCKKISRRKPCYSYALHGCSGIAEAGVEGANRMFVSGTPNPYSPKILT